MAVNESLIALMALADGADSAPSEEELAAYRRICHGFNEAASAWQDLKNKDVSALGELLTKNNLPELPQTALVEVEAACGN